MTVIATRGTAHTVSDSASTRYSVLVSADPGDIDAAQRLRYQVLGHGVDRYDEHSVHVLVRDNIWGELVGCYRMLPTGGAIAAGGLSAAMSFDITALDPLRMSMLELGRPVVRAGHRNSAVVLTMWSAILDYADRYGYDYVFGCVSVPIHPVDGGPGAQVRAVRDFVRRNNAAPDCYTVRPHRPVVVDGVHLDDIAPQRPPVIPARMRDYLRLGARICGEPAHDSRFGVAGFPMLLDRPADHPSN